MGVNHTHVPVSFRIIALVQERNRLFDYPLERLAGVIQQIGFQCDRCGKCCIRAEDGHVSLLDRDIAGIYSIDPGAIEPAPAPEFCDPAGTFYVSGYTLRTKDDAAGSCWFMEYDRCRIYDYRASVCRIYPYMLHREPDERGTVDWRYFAGIGQHGVYHKEIPADDCFALAREVKEYENALLTREISFLEFMQDYFSLHHLGHSPKMYEGQMRRYARGKPIVVKVYQNGNLEEYTCTRSHPALPCVS